jgi:hypothetical protein
MGRSRPFPKSPNVVHPTIPGAVGSRNSPALEGRDKEAEAKLIVDDAVEILRRLPSPEKTPSPRPRPKGKPTLRRGKSGK